MNTHRDEITRSYETEMLSHIKSESFIVCLWRYHVRLDIKTNPDRQCSKGDLCVSNYAFKLEFGRCSNLQE